MKDPLAVLILAVILGATVLAQCGCSSMPPEETAQAEQGLVHCAASRPIYGDHAGFGNTFKTFNVNAGATFCPRSMAANNARHAECMGATTRWPKGPSI